MEFVCQYCSKEFSRQCDLTRHENIEGNKLQYLQNFVEEEHHCKNCGKLLTELYGSGLYCSQSCANRRIHSNQTKQKISEGVDRYNIENGIIPVKLRPKSNKRLCTNCNGNISSNNKSGLCIKCYNPRKNKSTKPRRKLVDLYCKQCGVQINKKSTTGYCVQCWRKTEDCHIKSVMSGQHSAAHRVVRSKNEIAFCELCEQYFTNVTHNQPIFNGWDADIILGDYKIAVMWNGIWHYKQIHKDRSLQQAQNRDRLKVQQIISCGYTPYIIKDMGKADKHKVENEFYEFVRWLNDKNLCQHNN